VQDVFMTLMRAPKKYDATRGALGAFLYGVTRNRVIKHLERLPREISLEIKTKTHGHRNCFCKTRPRRRCGWKNAKRRQQVRAAVLELPVEFREAVVLCELEEMSYEEAAQMAGCRWDDSFAAASRTRFADGQAGNVSGRASSRERGAMKEFVPCKGSKR